MLIEDVACPVDKLGEMTQDLVDMFQKYGYKDASCFGHALEGNLHLVFSQVPLLHQHCLAFPAARASSERLVLLSEGFAPCRLLPAAFTLMN